MSDAPEKIVIVATHGPDDPEMATIPFVIANASLVMDVQTVVVLQGRAVLLAKKGIAQHVKSAGFPTLTSLLENFFAQEGQLHICTPCVKERDIQEDDLIDGAELTAGGRLIQEALEAKAVLNY